MIHHERFDFRAGLALLVLACVAHVWLVLPGFRNPPRDGHEFRQTQTALTAYWIAREGWALPPPLPLFGPSWSVPLEFPFYQGIVAALSRIGGLPLEPTGRAVALVFFYLALPGIHLLAARLALTRGQRLALIGLLLLSPVYAFFSRSISIESFALCASVWFLWSLDRLLPPGRIRGLAVLRCVALAVVAALAKITTYAVFLIPAALLTLRAWNYDRTLSWSEQCRRLGPAMIGPALGIIVGYAWVAYGDAVKAANPLSEFLTSANVRDWTYGTLSLRWNAGFWLGLLRVITADLIMSSTLLIGCVAWLMAGRGHGRWGLGLLLCFLGGPLVFANLYLVHNYYWYASGLFGLAWVLLGLVRLMDGTGAPRGAGWLAIGLVLTVQGWGYRYGLCTLQNNPALQERPPIGRILQQTTDEQEVIATFGWDWNPSLAYFAERKAIMLRGAAEAQQPNLDQIVAGLTGVTLGAFIAATDQPDIVANESAVAVALGMYPEPSLRNKDYRIYYPRERIDSLAELVSVADRADFRLQSPGPEGIFGLNWEHFEFAQLEDTTGFGGFSPSPYALEVPFGLSSVIIDNAPALNVHAPTRISFNPPAGATSFHMTWGFLPGAYADGNLGDGVAIELEFHAVGEVTPQVLWTAEHDPFTRPADRGPQELMVTFPPLSPGKLVLRVRPGPNRNISYDWVYLQTLRIE